MRGTSLVGNVTLSDGNVIDPFSLSKKVAQYDTQTKTWSYDTTKNAWDAYASSEYDPISQKIAIISSYGLWIYDAVTRSGSIALPQGQVPVVPAGENLIYYPPNDTFYLIASQ